jgi:hypothetical protein
MAGDLDDHARARVGTTINQKYRLEQLIGSGGMASVYEAVHQNNGNRVAIKMLHARLSISTDLHTRFLREGYVANKVGHRGAVRVLDDGTAEDGSVFLVMELLEGETLRARFERSGHQLPATEVCELTCQLLDVLAAAHAKGVVHRDLKPDNLFLTREGVLKVLDFGIARLAEAGAAHGATQTGRMMGTPAFMPPEQALGRTRQIDGQTDLWAVGATMFTLLSGQYVHDAETMEEMLIWAGSRAARSVLTVSPGLAPAIAAVIDRALTSAREERWANAHAMETALAEAYQATYGMPIAAARQSARPPLADLAGSAAALREPLPGAGGSGTMTASFATPPAGPKSVTTTAGVINGSTGSRQPAGVPTPRVRVALWSTVGAAAILVIGAGALLMMRQRAPQAVPVARPKAAASPPQHVETSPILPAAPIAATSTDQVPPADEVAPTPMPTAAPAPAPAMPRTSGSARRTVAPSTPPGVLTVHATPAAQKPNCDVPFFVDTQGIQRIRPECK